YSWGYQQLVRVLFRLDVRDSQTGLKLVRRDVLARSLPRMVEKRFAFDLELFVVARHLGYRRLFEAPLRIRHQFSSTILSRPLRTARSRSDPPSPPWPPAPSGARGATPGRRRAAAACWRSSTAT